VVKIHFAVLLEDNGPASGWRSSKEDAMFDLAWAEKESLSALVVVLDNDEVVEIHATSSVDARAVKAELGVE